jgi:hypothetical protein
MWRLTVRALVLCALCVGCENTDFYRADTKSWFGPVNGSAPQAPTTTAAPAQK